MNQRGIEMTRLRHYDNLGTARFVTFSCYRRMPALGDPIACEIVIQQIDSARRKHGFKLWGYVLMPEHVHLVIYPPDDMKLGLVIGEIKSKSARAFFAATRSSNTNEKRVFWQRRCYDHNCRTPETMIEKIKYCHKNPVVRGLVSSPSEWEWSSFNWYNGRRDVPLEMDECEVMISADSK